VAGTVRARLLANRRLGDAGARRVAAAGEAAEATRRVADSPYGRDVSAGMAISDAEHGVHATALWHLRVLAGWLPPGGSDVVRILAGGHEIANIESHMDALGGAPPTPPFVLGALGTAWPRVRTTRSIGAVRAALAASPWGDPGSDERAPFSAALRLAWARRVSERIPALRRWAAAGAAVVVANERFGNGRALTASATRDARRLLGPGCEASPVAAFAAGLAADVRPVFADAVATDDAWRAETALWRELRADAATRIRRDGTGRSTVAWVAVLLLEDARRVCAALEAAPWGADGLETFDAVV
jgi:hypothetical protein